MTAAISARSARLAVRALAQPDLPAVRPTQPNPLAALGRPTDSRQAGQGPGPGVDRSGGRRRYAKHGNWPQPGPPPSRDRPRLVPSAGGMISRLSHRHTTCLHAIRWSSPAGGLCLYPITHFAQFLHARNELRHPGQLPFQPVRNLKFPQLSSQTSGQGSRLPIYSIRRCGAWADMGQWVVSVLGHPYQWYITLLQVPLEHTDGLADGCGLLPALTGPASRPGRWP